ncbi:MAG: hypothetical protein JW934_16965 [Anaerolineae bacterium]|nr:hypothetical protein [Anaerolineae bacterium]
MPTFPTYRGELPQCLNPLTPRHYLLLAYWIYFGPTALKCYVYQADPELYEIRRMTSIFRAWAVPAYNNLLMMVLGETILFVVLVGLPLALVSGGMKGIPMNWANWLLEMAVSTVFAYSNCLLLSMLGALAGSAPRSVALSVSISVPLGMAMVLIFVIAEVGGHFLFVTLLMSTSRAHFYIYDHLVAVPLLCTQRAQFQLLQSSRAEGLRLICEVAASGLFFQRWASQAALYHYLHVNASPLSLFYVLLSYLGEDDHVLAPAEWGDEKGVSAL